MKRSSLITSTRLFTFLVRAMSCRMLSVVYSPLTMPTRVMINWVGVIVSTTKASWLQKRNVNLRGIKMGLVCCLVKSHRTLMVVIFLSKTKRTACFSSVNKSSITTSSFSLRLLFQPKWILIIFRNS